MPGGEREKMTLALEGEGGGLNVCGTGGEGGKATTAISHSFPPSPFSVPRTAGLIRHTTTTTTNSKKTLLHVHTRTKCSAPLQILFSPFLRELPAWLVGATRIPDILLFSPSPSRQKEKGDTASINCAPRLAHFHFQVVRHSPKVYCTTDTVQTRGSTSHLKELYSFFHTKTLFQHLGDFLDALFEKIQRYVQEIREVPFSPSCKCAYRQG